MHSFQNQWESSKNNEQIRSKATELLQHAATMSHLILDNLFFLCEVALRQWDWIESIHKQAFYKPCHGSSTWFTFGLFLDYSDTWIGFDGNHFMQLALLRVGHSPSDCGRQRKLMFEKGRDRSGVFISDRHEGLLLYWKMKRQIMRFTYL